MVKICKLPRTLVMWGIRAQKVTGTVALINNLWLVVFGCQQLLALWWAFHGFCCLGNKTHHLKLFCNTLLCFLCIAQKVYSYECVLDFCGCADMDTFVSSPDISLTEYWHILFKYPSASNRNALITHVLFTHSHQVPRGQYNWEKWLGTWQQQLDDTIICSILWWLLVIFFASV